MMKIAFLTLFTIASAAAGQGQGSLSAEQVEFAKDIVELGEEENSVFLDLLEKIVEVPGAADLMNIINDDMDELRNGLLSKDGVAADLEEVAEARKELQELILLVFQEHPRLALALAMELQAHPNLLVDGEAVEEEVVETLEGKAAELANDEFSEDDVTGAEVSSDEPDEYAEAEVSSDSDDFYAHVD